MKAEKTTFSPCGLFNKLLAERYVHVIDDFYTDGVSWLDDYLEEAEFFRPKHVNFPGATSFIKNDFKEFLTNKIQDMFQIKIAPAALFGEVRVQLKNESVEKIYIHSDHSFVLLVYLSDPPEHIGIGESGTSFYIHKSLNAYRFESLSAAKKLIFSSTVLRDSMRTEMWERWLTVSMKKNRAILYDGNLFHSGPPMAWGDSIETGRITQHFFLNLEK